MKFRISNLKEKSFYTKLFIIVLGLNLFFGFYRLGNSIFNVDAQHWYLRSQNFVKALTKGQFDKTFQDPKPGVTLMWLSGTNLEVFLTLYNKLYGFKPQIYTYETFPLTDFAAKFPIILVYTVSICFTYFSLRKLTNKSIAVLTVIFLSFQPYYLGVIRFLHVDGLLAIFLSMSLLALLLALNEEKNEHVYLIVSGIFAGLAALTKTQTAILAISIPAILLIDRYLTKKSLASYSKKLLVLTFTAFMTFFITFPAMWVKPIETIREIITESLYVASVGNTSVQPAYFYLNTIYRTVEPVTLLFIMGGTFLTIFNLRLQNKRTQITLISSIMFILIYLLQMSLVKQKVDRYILPIFPFASILSAYCFHKISIAHTRGAHEKAAIVGLAGYLASIMLYHAPFYETKAINSHETNIYGSLYSEVGKYLSEKPDAKNLKVMAMTKAYSLRPFTKGQVYNFEDEVPNHWTPDYLVTNDYWVNKYGKPKTTEQCYLEKSIYFRTKHFWDIYYCPKPTLLQP